MGGFAAFPTPVDGLSAAIGNLVAKQDRHGLNTVADIIGDAKWDWAPAADGNNVPAYVANVAGRTGFGPRQPLDLHDPVVVMRMIKAIVPQEIGRQPYGDDVYQAALADRFARLGLPVASAAPVTPAAPPIATPYAPAPGAATAASPAAPAAAPVAPGTDQQQGKVVVEVNFRGAPPGTRVDTQTMGGVVADTRIGYSMGSAVG